MDRREGRAARKGYLGTTEASKALFRKTGRDCEGRKAEVGHSQGGE